MGEWVVKQAVMDDHPNFAHVMTPKGPPEVYSSKADRGKRYQFKNRELKCTVQRTSNFSSKEVYLACINIFFSEFPIPLPEIGD